MHRINVSTLGFNLTREVPASVDEYNALAPKRTNPVLEDAVANILYRGTFAEFRSSLLDQLEKSTGVVRINHGTEEEPQWESDARFLKRLIAVQVQAGKTEAALRAEWQLIAQDAMDAASFPVAETESKGGSSLIGKNDLKNAETMQKDGKSLAVATKLTSLLNRPVNGDDVKDLARALGEYRRQVAAAAEAGLSA